MLNCCRKSISGRLTQNKWVLLLNIMLHEALPEAESAAAEFVITIAARPCLSRVSIRRELVS